MSKPAAKTALRPAIFLVRDGVLCERNDQTVLAGRAGQLISSACDGLSLLAETGTPIILLADRQPAASDGAQFAAHRPRMAGITKTLTFDEHADERLHPSRALGPTLLRAARTLDLNLASSLLICDTWSDAAAASEVGCQPILVMTGRGRDQMMLHCYVASRPKVWYAADLAMAALSVRTHLELIGATLPVHAARPRHMTRMHSQTVA